MPRNYPASGIVRAISTHGEQVTVTTTHTTADAASDWGAETTTTESDSAMALLQPVRQADRADTAATSGVAADAIAYILVDNLSVAIVEHSETDRTQIRDSFASYTVVAVDRRVDGVVRCEVLRS